MSTTRKIVLFMLLAGIIVFALNKWMDSSLNKLNQDAKVLNSIADEMLKKISSDWSLESSKGMLSARLHDSKLLETYAEVLKAKGSLGTLVACAPFNWSIKRKITTTEHIERAEGEAVCKFATQKDSVRLSLIKESEDWQLDGIQFSSPKL